MLRKLPVMTLACNPSAAGMGTGDPRTHWPVSLAYLVPGHQALVSKYKDGFSTTTPMVDLWPLHVYTYTQGLKDWGLSSVLEHLLLCA